GETGPSPRRFTTVDQHPLDFVRGPTELVLLPALLRIPALGWTDITEHEDHLMKGILRGVCADAEQFAYYRTGSVLPQVDQRQQPVLIGVQVAAPSGADRPPPIWTLSALNLAAPHQFRQRLGEQFTQGHQCQAKKRPHFRSWIGIKVFEVHSPILL